MTFKQKIITAVSYVLMMGLLMSCRSTNIKQQPLLETGNPFRFEGVDGFLFHFEANGEYSVMDTFSGGYLTMPGEYKLGMDKGKWRMVAPNRIKMTSAWLLSPPVLKYSSFKVAISTRRSLDDITLAVDYLLHTSARQIFSGGDFGPAFRATAPAPDSPPREWVEGTRLEIQTVESDIIPRRYLEKLQRDLKRLNAKPVWWEVTCDLEREDDTLKLIPEKGKAEAFLTIYRLRPFDVCATNVFPQLRLSDSDL